MKSLLKQVRISPKKANLVAGMVRGMKVGEALLTLKFMHKKASDIFYKLLFSAVSNAKSNFGKEEEDLFVEKINIGDGPTYKRGQSRSKGRVFSLLKRTSNLGIVLGMLSEGELSVKEVEEKKILKEAKVKKEKKIVNKKEPKEKIIKSKTDKKTKVSTNNKTKK